MPATSGSPTQNATSVSTPKELAGVPDDAFADGDLACVRSLWPQSTFRLRRTSLPAGVTPNNVTAIATLSGNGYWELFPQGGSMLSFPNIASLANFDDQNLDDGAIVYVESIRSYWSKLTESSPGAPNNITYIRNPSNTASWYRNEVPSISWQSQAYWYISTGGNDENPGTQASPLLTFAEFNRRVVSITRPVTVTVVNDQTEIFFGFFTAENDQATITIQTQPSINASSAVSDVPNYANPVPASNLRGTVAAASINFASYVGKFVQTADGYVAPVLSNSGATGYTPFWVKEDESIAAPTTGSSFDVITPRVVPSINVEFDGPTIIRFIRFTSAAIGQTPLINGKTVRFFACEFNGTYPFTASEAVLTACLFSGAGTTLSFINGNSIKYIGGGSTKTVSTSIAGTAIAFFKGFIFQGGDFQFPNLNSTLSPSRGGAIGSNYGLGIFGASGVGLQIRDDAVFKAGALYGINGTYGVSVSTGGTLEIEDGYTPSITGSTSDFIVDDNAGLTTISPLQPGVAVPTAKSYAGNNGVGWSAWNNPAGNFKRKLVSYSTLSKIISYEP